MNSVKIIGLVLLGLAYAICNVRADSAEVKVVSSGQCSSKILRDKGVDPSKFSQQVIFDPKKIKIVPERPTIPGCFRIVATNVTVKIPLRQLTGEFENRISGDANPNSPAMQCKKRSPKCGCGSKNACYYCDFCKNFKQLVHEGTVNNKDLDVDAVPNSCDCNIAATTYNFDVEVCTPDEKELDENVPSEVVNAVSDGKSFSLVTTMYGYNFRFNDLEDSGSSQAMKAIKARKARGMIACQVIVANVNVS